MPLPVCLFHGVWLYFLRTKPWKEQGAVGVMEVFSKRTQTSSHRKKVSSLA